MKVLCFEFGSFSLKVIEAEIRSKHIEILSYHAKRIMAPEISKTNVLKDENATNNISDTISATSTKSDSSDTSKSPVQHSDLTKQDQIAAPMGVGQTQVAHDLATGKPLQSQYSKILQNQNVTTPTEDPRLWVLNTLKQFMAEHKVHGEKILVIIPSTWVSNKIFELPFKNRKRLAQAITYEIEEMIPYRMENVIIDFQVLSQEDKSSRVLASILLKQHYDKLIECFEEIGLRIDIVIHDLISHIGISQSLALSDFVSTYAILDFGHQYTRVIFYHQGKPIGVRTFSMGAATVIKDLQKRFDVDEAEALRFLVERAAKLPLDAPLDTLQEEERELLDCLKNTFSLGILELNQTFLGMMATRQFKLERLFVCGGLTQIPFFIKHLEGSFGVPVEMLKTFINLNPELLTQAEEIRPFIVGGWGGLCRFADKRLYNDINFQKVVMTPENVLEEIKTFIAHPGVVYTGRLAIVMLVILAIHFIFGMIFLSSKTNAVSSDFRSYVGKVFPTITYTQKRQVVEDEEFMTSFLQRKLEEQQNQLLQLDKKKLSASHLLKLLGDASTRSRFKFFIKNFSIEKNTFTCVMDLENPYDLQEMKKYFAALLEVNDLKLVVGSSSQEAKLFYKLEKTKSDEKESDSDSDDKADQEETKVN